MPENYSLFASLGVIQGYNGVAIADAKHQVIVDAQAFGRYIYSKRMQIIGPVFANIRSNLGLGHFSLRGKTKVDIQWKLFAIIYNIRKIYRYGAGFA